MMEHYILDTDIGTDVDDALALAYLASAPGIDIVGVTTVHGNAPLRAQLAKALLELAGLPDVHVIAGRSTPIRASTVEGFHWHELWGHEGLGVVQRDQLLGTDENPLRDDAAEFIVEQILARPGEITLVMIGPPTNLARALQLEPRIAGLVKSVIIMGGIVDRSQVDWAPQFETNLNADPGAAEIVFAHPLPIVLVPLEVTLQVYLEPKHLDVLRASSKPLAHALLALIDEMREPFLAFNERFGLAGSDFDLRTYMHDPLAVHVALGSQHAKLRSANLVVGREGEAVTTVEVDEGGIEVEVCYSADTDALVSEWLALVG